MAVAHVRPGFAPFVPGVNYETPSSAANSSTVVVQSFVFQALNSALYLTPERAVSDDELTVQENSDAIEAWAEYTRGRAKTLAADWKMSDLLSEP